MAIYVDGFVVPVPRSRLDDYKKLARKAGKIWREHGALDYCECVADDVSPGKRTSFPRSVKLKPDEVVDLLVDHLQVAPGPRSHQRQGHAGSAARRDA